MKRRMHKGFTLVELLIVIGIMGILGAMGMIGGSEANNIANANKIIEEFKIIGAAMNMYYADNRSGFEAKLAEADSTAGTSAETYPVRIKKGIAAYMKNTDSVEDGTSDVEGKYRIQATKSEWWLIYKLADDQVGSKLAKILENKATDAGLYATAAETATGGAANSYKSTAALVYYKVR